MTGAVDAFIDALPKVELHVHLEGSVRPATLLRLAQRHGAAGLPSTVDELQDFYRFRDFDHFVRVYYAICNNLRDEEDFAVVVEELGADLAAQNVRYAEVTFTPYNHTRRGVPAAVGFAGVEAGRAAAEAATGVRLRFCTDVPGEFGPEAGMETVATDGPEAVRQALDDLGAERVGDGVRSLEDPRLLDRLRSEGIALEVCPSSNVRLGVAATIEDHPLPRLLDSGVTVALNSDDPPMFGTTLSEEYRLVATKMGVAAQGIADLAQAGVRSAFLPEPDEAHLLAQIAALPLPT